MQPSPRASFSSSSRSPSRSREPRSSPGRAFAGPCGPPSRVADVTAVVVTYNGLPWLERCLESVRGHETIVVDNGSTDGTLELVRERFPDVRLIEQENRGLAAGWNSGVLAGSGRYFLILNSDAWAVGDGVEALVAFADEHPDAAVVGPRLANPDGTLQR